MNSLPNFLHQFLGVVVGVFLLIMTAAFILVPYSLSTHPGEAPVAAMSRAYHPT